jgi:hypothetical protein
LKTELSFADNRGQESTYNVLTYLLIAEKSVRRLSNNAHLIPLARRIRKFQRRKAGKFFKLIPTVSPQLASSVRI